MMSTERVIKEHLDSLKSHQQRPDPTLLWLIAYQALIAWMVEHDKTSADVVSAVCAEMAEHWSDIAREENNTNARHAIVDIAHILEEIGADISTPPA